MLTNIKKWVRNNKEKVRNILIVTVIVVIMLVLYKLLFYSTAESSVYGMRLRDINKHEISNKELKEYEEKSKLEGINKIDIKIKGKLIKYFIEVPNEVSNDDVKNKINEMLGFLTEDIKGFYDITFYVNKEQEEEIKCIMIGYKHKSKESVIYDEV